MDTVLIIDFGSQVTQLIARRLRERGFFCTVEPYKKITMLFIHHMNPKAIILSGGPSSVLDKKSPGIPHEVFDSGIPILGICYGLQLMVKCLGGVVKSGESREFGRTLINKKGYVNLLTDLTTVWMSHGDHVTRAPIGFEVLATSTDNIIAVIADNRRKFYGVQFHPEVSHTENGGRFLEKFCIIADVKPTWNMKYFLECAYQEIKETVGNNKVFCAFSGGVDSTVVAVLLSKILKNQVHCIFVDHGLLRRDESEEVIQFVHDNYKEISFSHINASEKFFSALKGVTDPEKKRKIIGKLFIDIFSEEAQKDSSINANDFLAQGTLYPDIIESTANISSGSHAIKSHHNVGGLPDTLPLKILEPVKMLFKDEVRHLGHELGLPDSVINRHPFPGPGLAVRILSEVTEEKCKLLRKADHIFLEEIKKEGLYNNIWQAFAVLLPIQTVGVMGDTRSYENVCALRAVVSVDGMTADSYPFKHVFLARVSNRIINEVPGINRVVYDCTSKPPATIEWE